MSVPSMILSDIYDLLCKHNEIPLMEKGTFINWLAKGFLYSVKVELQTLVFECEKPFSCFVVRDKNAADKPFISDEELKNINQELENISSRFRRVKAFW